MKRFFALFAALTLLCTGISAQTAACRTETGIAYRDAAGMSIRFAGWTFAGRRIGRDFRPSCGSTAGD